MNKIDRRIERDQQNRNHPGQAEKNIPPQCSDAHRRISDYSPDEKTHRRINDQEDIAGYIPGW